MKRRSFLGTVVAGVGALLLPRTSKADSNTQYRDHSADTYPIIYTTGRQPTHTSAIARIFCHMSVGDIGDDWFYCHSKEYFPNGCNHSDFSCFQGMTMGDSTCYRMGNAGFLNSWTTSDWSFLQENGWWRNWNTFIDEDTGKLNGFCPADLAKHPHPLHSLTRLCFIDRYNFIMFIHENGEKIDKIRMNGLSTTLISHQYTRFPDREFIPANEWLTSKHFIKEAALHGIDVLRVEYFPVLEDSSPKTVEAEHSTCHWSIPQMWNYLSYDGFSTNVFATVQQ